MNRSEKTSWRILLVEDNALDVADAKAALLAGSGRRCHFSVTALAGEALKLCAEQPPYDCMVLDFELPDGDALDVLARLPHDDDGLPHLPVVILTGGGASGTSRGALRAGAQDYVGKAWLGPESLSWAVENAIERRKIAREVIAERLTIETQRQELLAAERAARKESERIALVKDEFLATLSHELRTPLAVIVGWTTILQRSPGNADVLRRGIDAIARNGTLQAQLIDALLDMSRIVSGKLQLDVDVVDIDLLVGAVADMLRPGADAKEVRLSVSLGDIGPRQVRGDAVRLQQVLTNLLGNALKFTPAGGDIAIATSLLPNGSVEVAVSDNGEGIAPQFIPFLFDRFSQANGKAARVHGGLGLGLSIVKQLVLLHGGVVSGSSPGPGLGSTFKVILPPAEGLALAAPQALPALDNAAAPPGQLLAAEVDLKGISVLLVDDHDDILELSRRLLADCGASVVAVTSAAAALRQLRRVVPDVLVSDISMPDMNGYDLITEVRTRMALSAQQLPAVAISAFARPQDQQRALGAGYQAYLVKPIRPHLLTRTVASLAHRSHASNAPNASNASNPAADRPDIA